jgi:winged helix DNA-binding protein
VTVSDAKRAVEMARGELASARLDGRELWFAPRELGRVPASAHLLPNYHEYFIAYTDRSAVGVRLGHTRPISISDARVPHVVFVGGRLVGEWRRVIERDAIVIELVISTPLSAAETTRVQRAAGALGSFFERAVRVKSPARRRRS